MATTTPTPLPGDELLQLFPRRWLSGVMLSDEVDLILNLGGWQGPPDTQSLIGLGWTPESTSQFIADCTRASARPERWRPCSEAWVMSLHPTDRPSADAPIGFLGFRPGLEHDPARAHVLQFRLSLDLVWIAPQLRGRGYGRHLAAHLARYLETYPVPPSHFGNTLEGLKVSIIRGTDTSCRWLATRMAQTFEQDALIFTMAGTVRTPWPVVSVDVIDD